MVNIKGRIRKLERMVHKCKQSEAQIALWAERVKRARQRAGLPIQQEPKLSTASSREENLNLAELLNRARRKANG